MAASKVFITRLAGLPVIDPGGDHVGRLRDVVVIARPGRQPPRVLGLVVEIQHRRRIFVPMGRVTSVDVGAVVLATGTVNLKRFEQRAPEQLVLAELLDRRVTVTDSSQPAVVVDAAIEQARNRDWELTRVAVRDHAGRPGRIGRRGHLRQVGWDEIDGLAVPQIGQGAEHLLAVLAELRPADVAATLAEMPIRRRGEVAAALDDDRLADVLEELDGEDRIGIVRNLAEDRAADVLEAMDPDDAADLLAELAEPERDRLLTLMEPEEAAPVRRLLIYADDVAGGLMTSEPVILTPDATVAEALARVRNPDLSPALASQVFVCRPPSDTPTGRYLGAAHIQRLLRESPSTLVSGVLDGNLEPLRPGSSLTDVTRMLATYNLVSAAVVDESNRLVGAVTVDDILDALLPAGWRDRSNHG